MHAFEYHRPASSKDAVSLKAKKSDGKYLAGGQSLVQAMKLRLSSPSDLIDLGSLKELAGIKVSGSAVEIGAMTRHADVANSADYIYLSKNGFDPVPEWTQGFRNNARGFFLPLASEIWCRNGGVTAQFLQQSALVGWEGLSFRLKVPIRPLAEPATVNRAREALAAHFGREVRIEVEVGAVEGPTAAAVARQRRAEEQAEAQAAIEADPFVQTLLKDFGGTIVPGSVHPAAANRPAGE